MREWTERKTAGGHPSAFAELLLHELLGVTQAWKMLHDPQIVRDLGMEGYLELCLQAGYSREASEAAAREWGLKRMRMELPV